MLTKIYVVDYVVDDLEAAKQRLDRIFATEPLWFHPGMAPGSTLNAMYYQMPGNGIGVHSIGLFDRSGDGPKEAPEGVILVGILCDDIHKTTAELKLRGIEFLYPEPRRYAVGINNITEPLCGVSYSIAQHDPDGYQRANQMMKTRAGTSDYGDPTQGGMLQQMYVIDIAVRDFDAAVRKYRALFGVEPIDTTGIGSSSTEYRSAHFPAPGDGTGIHSVGLFSPTTDQPTSHTGKRLSRFLDTHGDGVFLLGFLVEDIDAMQRELERRGFRFQEDTPQDYQMGRGNVIENVCGADLWFAQHHPDGYQKFRKLEQRK